MHILSAMHTSLLRIYADSGIRACFKIKHKIKVKNTHIFETSFFTSFMFFALMLLLDMKKISCVEPTLAVPPKLNLRSDKIVVMDPTCKRQRSIIATQGLSHNFLHNFARMYGFVFIHYIV